MPHKKVDIGRPRAEGDGSRRFTPAAITFDTRANVLATEVRTDWEPQIQEQWHRNQDRLKGELIFEFGESGFEQKLADFVALGPAPWSVVARHNAYMSEVRGAFVAGAYYPALLGACGLGERILNHLVLALREEYEDHPATKHVAHKQTVDDWLRCIRTLREWNVFDEAVKAKYEQLMGKRHAAVHYRSELDVGSARDAALDAVRLLQDLISDVFAPHGATDWYFDGPIGRSYVRRDAEDEPFVKRFILPSCVLVSPAFRFEPNPSAPGGFDVYDDAAFGVDVPDMSDREFANWKQS